MVVVGDGEGAEPEESVALGEGVEVEKDFVRRVVGIGAAAVERVLFAFFSASEIEVAAQAVRNGEVGLLNASEHLLVQLLLKRLGLLEEGVGVGVFGVEVGEDF